MTKKKIIWISVIAIIVVLIVISSVSKGGEQIEYITEEVGIRDLIKTVSATGSVESADEINLSFSSSGRIARINVAVGDEVVVGQTLAQLNTASVGADVANANANVAAAQADLDRVLSGASSEDIAVTEQQLVQANVSLNQARTSLANLLNERDDKLTTYRETALNGLATKNFYSRAALDTVKTILTDTDAKPLLSVISPQYKNISESSYAALNSQYQTIQATLNSITSLSSNDEIEFGLSSLISYQSDISGLLVNTYLMLENSLTGSSFTQTELDAYKTSVRTQQTNLDTALTSLQTAKANLSNNIVYYENQVKIAEDNINAQEEAVLLAEAQLAFKEAGPRDFEISSYEARLQQAQATLQTAYARLADYMIKAPISGTIVKVDKKLGEQAGLTDSVITIIGKSSYEIEVDIPESDIADIRVGDGAEITLDAYGSALVFSGHISFIEPAETTISDVVYYKVRVAFDLPDQAIKPGMTANVDILIDQKEAVVAVPARAVFEVDNIQQIKVLNNDEAITKEVDTGLKDDTGYIEIISGVEIGETIIITQSNGQ
ncbi:efflux RND transporter periplasmic adaptor subunit [Patescibacteria group bacterium]|nr:efflux RND transporter periplasmic adaptor subunit [Patescibacteria group bacterium]